MSGVAQWDGDRRVALDGIVSSLAVVEQTLAGVMAARDGLLALAGQVAADVAGGPDEADVVLRAVAGEIAAVLRVSDRTVQRRIDEAGWLVSRFPQVWAAQGAGQITAAHTRVIIDAGEHLEDPDARAEYCVQVLEVAAAESPNRLRPIANRIAEQLQPRSIDERHQDARDKRGVWVKEQPDGMADLIVHGPAVLIHGAFDRLTRMGKHIAAATGEERTLGQIRSDLAADLLLTGVPAGHDADGLLGQIRADVAVTVPVTTLIGAPGSPPAELDGTCPIDPVTARRLAGAASGWDRVLTHPVTGGMLAVDRYRPSEQLKRHLKNRDLRCRFPTCGYRARDCDIDHTHDAALGGETRVENLADFCRRHHVLKHHSPWQVKQIGRGELEWTSPTGRVYIDRPPPQNTVTFTEHQPAPF